MRPWTLLAALLLVSGCTHKTRPAAPAARRPAPAAPAKAETKAPSGTGATGATGSAMVGDAAAPASPLPATVDLVHFDLTAYGSGRQDYEATAGDQTLEVHRARSAAGLAHGWASTTKRSAYRQGDTTYSVDGQRCERTTGKFAQAAFSMLGEPYVAQQAGVLAPVTLGIPSAALKPSGTATVAGVKVTTYTFDTTEPLLVARAHVAGEVALDAHHVPLRSHGRVELVHAEAGTQAAPLTWTFRSTDLGGHGGDVEVTLPDACKKTQATATTLSTLPMPKGAKKGMTLGEISSYLVPQSAARTEAFFKRALPAHGWRIEATPAAQVFKIRRGHTRATLTVMPMGDSQTQVGVVQAD